MAFLSGKECPFRHFATSPPSHSLDPCRLLSLWPFCRITISTFSSKSQVKFSSIAIPVMAGSRPNPRVWHIFNSLQEIASFAGRLTGGNQSSGAAYGNLTYNSEPNCVRWRGLDSLFSVPRVNKLPSHHFLCEYQMSFLWTPVPKCQVPERKGLRSKCRMTCVASRPGSSSFINCFYFLFFQLTLFLSTESN